MTSSDPSGLILARCRAFSEADFGFIYESYHPESHFRQMFPDRDDYIRYGQTELRYAFRVRECRILREEMSEDEARVIWYMDMTFRGERSRTLELSYLRKGGGRWLYFGGLKMVREDFSGEIEDISWDDFEGDEGPLL